MLFRCNILALVGGGAKPRFHKHKVIIWDDYQNKCLAELEFRMPVTGVRLRKDRILVVVETKIYVYNFADVSLLRALSTCPNPKGLVSLCSEAPILACPGESAGVMYYNVGKPDQKLWPASNTGSKEMGAQVCNNGLACLAMNLDGSLIATASEKGTLIRVWSTETGGQLHEFRRGSDRAEIFSIAFNKDSTLLVVSSDKATVHLFSLTDKIKNGESSFKGIGSFFASKWSAASFRVPEVRTICTFGKEDQTVIVVCADGCYFKYRFSVSPQKEAKVHTNPEFAMFLKKKQPISTSAAPSSN
eukprot:CAMPEP_0201553218 /NCGR_PEP_ID=MMETSP0173_2-20130828/19514_1 /ASSEMBLY_ACC=CAM_ASM_000268 /TAXON_ID=218659 /ORGANISM="Vexillifera sp., Strain DIVA3 564/2" /LENGTH=301 /DNA_ID=CAMNT_0047963853 /DNA_START=217 /DNA_END=1122 /DNA_ORIENTATION=-